MPKRAPESKGPKVPGYIVTFSDMVTLLLTFFVMLLSLANVQDPELFGKGRDSFLRELSGLGLGTLFGYFDKPYFGRLKTKYSVEPPDESYSERSLDAKEEQLRRIFQRLRKHMDTMPSQITGKKKSFSVTDIHFAPGASGLNAEAKKFLREFCINLEQEADPRGTKIYVLGLAGDEVGERGQWILSARRAEAVADFVRSGCDSERQVYSWGAGPGGEWAEQGGLAARQTHILIGILLAE